MKQLYFVRHGQTEWNAIRRMQGQWNSDLSPLGREQARVNGELLAGLGIETIFASPLDRTRQTAEIINGYLGLPVTYDERIMEWDCGDWSGYLYAEVMAQWPDEWAALQADRFHFRGPNCENYPDMFARARPFLAELEHVPAERIAIVSHGMIGKVMIAAVLGLGEEETLAISQPNDVIFVTTEVPGGMTASHYVAGTGPHPGLEIRAPEQPA
ncbi:MAG: histidine phosphatase family protein [Pseudomonadales bacterium]|nr:histidine phosphatase family protein [Pseudomonadales bacterium]